MTYNVSIMGDALCMIHCREEGCIGPRNFPRAGILHHKAREITFVSLLESVSNRECVKYQIGQRFSIHFLGRRKCIGKYNLCRLYHLISSTKVASDKEEIHSYSVTNIDSVEINTFVIMMREWQLH